MTTRLLLDCAKQISITGNTAFEGVVAKVKYSMDRFCMPSGSTWAWHGSVALLLDENLDMTHAGSDIDVVVYFNMANGRYKLESTCYLLRVLGFTDLTYLANLIRMKMDGFTVEMVCTGWSPDDLVFECQTFTNFHYSADCSNVVPSLYANALNCHEVAECMWKLVKSLSGVQLTISSMTLAYLLQGACKQVDTRIEDVSKLPYLAFHMLKMARLLGNNGNFVGQAGVYLKPKNVGPKLLMSTFEIWGYLSPKQKGQIDTFASTWGVVFKRLGLVNEDLSANLKCNDNYLKLKIVMMHGAFRAKHKVQPVNIVQESGNIEQIYIDSLEQSQHKSVINVVKEIKLFKVLLGCGGFENDHYAKMKKALFSRMRVQCIRALGGSKEENVLYFVPEALHEDAERIGINLLDDSDEEEEDYDEEAEEEEEYDEEAEEEEEYDAEEEEYESDYESDEDSILARGRDQGHGPFSDGSDCDDSEKRE